MNRVLLIIATTLVLGTLLQAQATYPFLRTDVAPRVAALGGAFVAMQEDANLLFVNPAGLATVARSASLSYLDHLLDISAGSVAITTEFGPIGRVGFGVLFTHYGEFDRTDALMNTSGTFTATDIALVAGTGLEIAEGTYAGANIKFIHSSIADFTSSAIAADFGVLHTIPDQQLAFGASLLNAGTQLSAYNGRREFLPLDLRVGVAKRPEHLPVWLNVNLHRLQEGGLTVSERLQQFSFGAEFDMSASLRFRVGYNNKIRNDLKIGTSAGLAGFSGGLGISVAGTMIDYAFNSYGAAGGLHRLGVTTAW